MNGWDFRVHSGLHDTRETPVVPRHERPVLLFADYAVAFHVAATASEQAEPEPEGTDSSLEQRALESYERDMLLYAYRHVAPLVTRPLADRSRVTAGFARELVFESEGSPIQLHCAGAAEHGRRRRATVFASRTSFYRSTVTVVTIVLRPPPARASRSRLNEFDLIKLAKLWEGGERLPEPGSPAEERGPVRFDAGHGEISLQTLIRLFAGRGWSPDEYESDQLAWAMGTPGGGTEPGTASKDARRHYRVGTISLKLPPAEENRRLLTDARAVKDQDADNVPPPDSLRWRRVVALGGLMQGLLDFEEIGPAELSDVFAEATIDEESLLAFHKGTLLSLTLGGSREEEERDAQLARPIGMSPYLVIPHAVLLHNEQRLKSALIRVNELLRGQEGDRALQVGGRPVRLPGGRTSIADTEAGIRDVSEALAQHLPNVFHYESERALYDEGTKARGFADFEPLIRARLEELQRRLDGRVRQRDNWTLGLTLTFFAITALQLALQSVPWWGSLLILVALAVLVWQLRRKLF